MLYSQLQNREAQRSKSPNNFSDGPFEDFKTLASKSSDNVEKIDVNATIDDAILHITRTETLTGNEKKVLFLLMLQQKKSVRHGESHMVFTAMQIFLAIKKVREETAAKERAEADKKK